MSYKQVARVDDKLYCALCVMWTVDRVDKLYYAKKLKKMSDAVTDILESPFIIWSCAVYVGGKPLHLTQVCKIR